MRKAGGLLPLGPTAFLMTCPLVLFPAAVVDEDAEAVEAPPVSSAGLAATTFLQRGAA